MQIVWNPAIDAHDGYAFSGGVTEITISDSVAYRIGKICLFRLKFTIKGRVRARGNTPRSIRIDLPSGRTRHRASVFCSSVTSNRGFIDPHFSYTLGPITGLNNTTRSLTFAFHHPGEMVDTPMWLSGMYLVVSETLDTSRLGN